jgi:hypothetical protein
MIKSWQARTQQPRCCQGRVDGPRPLSSLECRSTWHPLNTLLKTSPNAVRIGVAGATRGESRCLGSLSVSGRDSVHRLHPSQPNPRHFMLLHDSSRNATSRSTVTQHHTNMPGKLKELALIALRPQNSVIFYRAGTMPLAL